MMDIQDVGASQFHVNTYSTQNPQKKTSYPILGPTLYAGGGQPKPDVVVFFSSNDEIHNCLGIALHVPL
jgi:hypothetical protein